MSTLYELMEKIRTKYDEQLQKYDTWSEKSSYDEIRKQSYMNGASELFTNIQSIFNDEIQSYLKAKENEQK